MAAGVLPFLVPAIQAATAMLSPNADTTLLEAFPTNNLGGQTWLNAGTTQSYTRNRALLKFDVTNALPANARVTSVLLTVSVTRSPVDGDLPSTFDLHRVLVPWGEGGKTGEPPVLGAPATEGEACWTERFARTGAFWAAPGGGAGVDFVREPSADTYVYGVNFSPYTFDSAEGLVRDVQLWLEQPARNFGWLLKTRSEAENFSARRFASREDEFLSPQLWVEYETVWIQRIARTGDRVTLEFLAEAGKAYGVEYCDRLESGSGEWTVLSRVAAGDQRWLQVEDETASRARFYRLRVE